MTLAKQAREAAGLTLREAARRARIGVPYLRRVEHQGAPYALARRLAYLYQCPIDLFLPQHPRTKEDSKTPDLSPARRSRSRRAGKSHLSIQTRQNHVPSTR